MERIIWGHELQRTAQHDERHGIRADRNRHHWNELLEHWPHQWHDLLLCRSGGRLGQHERDFRPGPGDADSFYALLQSDCRAELGEEHHAQYDGYCVLQGCADDSRMDLLELGSTHDVRERRRIKLDLRLHHLTIAGWNLLLQRKRRQI